MSAIVWSQQTGDPRMLAWRYALVDSVVDDKVVGADLRGSWGMFELWVHGVNLCAHEEQGEIMQGAHWYLLPIAEWLIDNWNALFHEQRLPVPEVEGAATTAARAVAQLEAAPDRAPVAWGFPAEDADDRAEQYQDWSFRHRLSAAAPEAPLPTVWFRRAGANLEVSLGTGETASLDGQVDWIVSPRVSVVSVEESARVTERALMSLLDELVARGASDGRASRARERLDEVTSSRYNDERLAWLVGLRGNTSALAGLREVLEELDPQGPATAAYTPERRAPVLLAIPVATLFGSLSPVTGQGDVRKLVEVLHGAPRPTKLVEHLNELAAEIAADEFRDLQDGEAGGELGDRLSRHLPQERSQVGITQYITGHLGIAIRTIELSDSTIRAVTLLHEDGRAAIAVNLAYGRGHAPHVVRFTLAHELGHLIYDRPIASRLAIASGSWAPRRVERRANGFAAGLLMPERLLRRYTSHESAWPNDPEALGRLARTLGVGVTALAERLQNVGMLSRPAADGLLDALLP